MSECPHTDNADKCTCEPGCGCPGYELPPTACDKVAKAIELANRLSAAETFATHYAYLADAAIAAHLDALKTDGYALVKLPVPAYGPDREGQFTWKPSVSSVTATPNDDGSWSIWDEDFDMTPSDAQELAATLLAAAAKAEAQR